MGIWSALSLCGSIVGGPSDPIGISGGNLADECQFPGVVAFRAGENSCTGVIVHPRVMITAAHCLAAGVPDRVRFGESYSGWERRSDVERCEADPAYAEVENAANDIGYCVLAAPVDELAPVPVLAGCETEHLQLDTITAIVGFGIPEEGGAFGRKRYAFTTVASELRTDGTITIGDAGANGCIGDSGGPALVQLPDGTWRVAGLFSRGPECGGGPNTFRVLADRVAWLEEHSGFDITPCFDDDGEWTATPECDAFDADPRMSDEGWDHYCDGERITPMPTCETVQSDTSSSSDGSSSSSTTIDHGETSTSSMIAGSDGEGCGCTTRDRRGDFAPMMWALVVLWSQIRPAKRASWREKRLRAAGRDHSWAMLRARASAREIAGGMAGTDDDGLVRARAEHDSR